MKVIFLDIDGVFNHVSWQKTLTKEQINDLYRTNDAFDPATVVRFNRVIRETGAKIVVSSSWRNLFPEVDEILKRNGVEGEIIGHTPSKMSLYHRGGEIALWLDDTDYPVDTIAIVDDESDMHHLMPYLVQTTWQNGLQDEHADRLIEMLSVPNWPSLDR